MFAKKDLSQIAIEAVAFLSEASGHSNSTHLLMSVESLCWALTDFVTTHQLPQLWEKIVLAAQRSRAISLRKWQLINEFIHERLGMILYPPFKMRKDVGIASSETKIRIFSRTFRISQTSINFKKYFLSVSKVFPIISDNICNTQVVEISSALLANSDCRRKPP